MRRQVMLSIAVLAVATVFLAVQWGRQDLGTGVSVGAVGAVVTAAFGWRSLRRGRHTPWSRARALIADDHAVVLWKPGCRYCERLLRRLGPDQRITWVNVWHDPEAQAKVCALNGGDEYTPTAIVGTEVLRNPSADELLARLPH